jgi:nucleoid-associated protein YgaU
MTETAAKALDKTQEKARLVVLDARLEDTDEVVSFCFNPTEFQIQKANTFAEIPIPGLDVPPIQFVRGGGKKLTFDLLLDTTQELEDVRKKYVNKLRRLMMVRGDLHAPPVLRFYWDKRIFTGVLESLNVTYSLFDKRGRPMRAKASLALKQYKPPAVQMREQAQTSPDVDKTYVVKAGDTLSGIAAAAYDDPARWRDVARANGIVDPRELAPGRSLRIPRIVGAVR